MGNRHPPKKWSSSHPTQGASRKSASETDRTHCVISKSSPGPAITTSSSDHQTEPTTEGCWSPSKCQPHSKSQKTGSHWKKLRGGALDLLPCSSHLQPLDKATGTRSPRPPLPQWCLVNDESLHVTIETSQSETDQRQPISWSPHFHYCFL